MTPATSSLVARVSAYVARIVAVNALKKQLARIDTDHMIPLVEILRKRKLRYRILFAAMILWGEPNKKPPVIPGSVLLVGGANVHG